ncbi:MAG TPA: histidine kinase, partial [Pseudonocardiaceae bacterium]
RRGWLAWGIAAATLTSQLGLLALVLRYPGELPDHVTGNLAAYGGGVVVATAFPVVGAMILARHPRHVIGWMMCATGGAVIVDAIARGYAVYGLYLRPGRLPLAEYAAWVASWNWFPSILVPLFFIPLLFPHGQVPSRRWRAVALGGAIWIAVTTTGLACLPGSLEDFPDVASPVSVSWGAVLAVPVVLTPVALGTAFAAVLVRRRRAVGDEREQLRWLLYAAGVALVGWTLSFLSFEWNLLAAVLTLGPLTLLPVAVGIAIVRYRLYDIDVIINRTLVYGGLTCAVLGVYGLVVLAASYATPISLRWQWSVLVVAAVAVIAYPVREWLQRGVNRLMYGDRDNPGVAMSRLARRVADTLSPTELLPAIAETIGQVLRLPYVAVEVARVSDGGHSNEGGARPVAAYGTPRGEPHRVALVHQGERVGTLVLGKRSATEQLTPADLRVLDDVARQVAVAAHTVRLTDDLQRSRERLVLAREEERRRLRRDLHDGLGSALAGLALHAGNARRALPAGLTEVARCVAQLEDGIGAAVVDVRRIVDDLRPPALDELGLLDALRQQVAASPLRVSLDAPAELAPLPAAVEVAAYRIVVEALVNAARHSRSDHATVRVSVHDGPAPTLRLEVRDAGVGPSATPQAGVGLQSMRERAAELGGVCEVGPGADCGTLVRAVLPLPTGGAP